MAIKKHIQGKVEVLITAMWKTIEDFPDYQVSNAGEVMSCKFEKEIILKPGMNNCGYLFVALCQNGIPKNHLVHRLVLKAFVGKCPKGLEAHHLNGIKTDNRLFNLEYVIHSENQLHAFRTGLQTPSTPNEKAVIQRSKAGQLIAVYKSQSEASRKTGVGISSISYCCSGRYKTAGNFLWEFADQAIIKDHSETAAYRGCVDTYDYLHEKYGLDIDILMDIVASTIIRPHCRNGGSSDDSNR